MTALATVADVEVRLARTLTEAEKVRVAVLLDDASATIRTWTGQQFTEATDTVRLHVRNGRITLPQRPVTAVSAVEDMNGNDVTFSWYLGDSFAVPSSPLNVWELEPYSTGLTTVAVTYTHGYATVPDVVVKVCCQLAARGLQSTPDQGGIVEEGIGDYRYRLGSIAAAGGLLPEEKADLEPFRRSFGTVWAA